MIPRAVRRALRARARSATRRLLAARARDVTDAWAGRGCLVLAPHPDDEVLGCGVAVMRRLAGGSRVQVVMVTDGGGTRYPPDESAKEVAAVRREEAREAARRLGLEEADLRFLGFADGTVSRQVDRLTEGLASLLSGWGPSDLLVPSSLDHHPDHRAVARAARAAARLHPQWTTYEYPVWFWTHAPWVRGTGAGLRGVVVDPLRLLLRCPVVRIATDGFLARKQEAFGAYRSRSNLDPGFLECFFQAHELFFPTRSR